MSTTFLVAILYGLAPAWKATGVPLAGAAPIDELSAAIRADLDAHGRHPAANREGLHSQACTVILTPYMSVGMMSFILMT